MNYDYGFYTTHRDLIRFPFPPQKPSCTFCLEDPFEPAPKANPENSGKPVDLSKGLDRFFGSSI